ncbi:hypothetical protein ORI89_18805 [Sphingobacterium sp. UT-1RO-CII-1]|uniref:hypothetical protein n=1 Tax=Sphingobacterium sp. UT-1RO-CII-1 TaxID=2995225 RepID=UPI00227CF789|nr:hypothetical protein [Sphingobacterium sp. UT-1RO-CII-1]MCY4781708.1 hypothetical protein [Sphingobacterium sp. UT-1RO-CII-1]
MKDVTRAVRTAVVSKLRDKVTLDGNIVKVYGTIAPVSNAGTYIYTPMQSSADGSAKDYFSTDHAIDVEVVYCSEDGTDSNPLDDMVEQVMDILAVKHQIDMPQTEGVTMVDFEFVRSTSLIDYGGTYTILRRVLSFNCIVDEG